MKDEDYHAFERGERLEGGIRTAVAAWCANRAAAKAQYGPIASWNTSEVTNMYRLFMDKAGFNEDISRWDVSNVTDLVFAFERATSFNGDLSSWDVGRVMSIDGMFNGATSFNRQLGGTWSASTAQQHGAFFGSGGSIA